MTGETGDRIAVILFNLGGPDDQASVKPFMFNQFNAWSARPWRS